MMATRRAGRIIGVLILLQMAGSAAVNFALEAPLFGEPGFLINAAPHAQALGLAALLGLANEASWVAIAITALPILLKSARTLALWLIALAVVDLAVAVIENSDMLSMLSLSEAYTKATAIEREPYQALRLVVASARNWAHFIGRMLDGLTILIFCAGLYRSALVPRVLAGFGLFAALLMIPTVARPLFGRDVIFPMLMPIGVSQLLLALWLTVKGLRDSNGATAA